MSIQQLGKYQLVKKLATGGMAEVWLARQTGIEGFNRMVVLKRILPHLAEDPEFVQMFLNEARIAARFSHPNIATIFDLGEVDGEYFIAMEYVHGDNLGRVMRTAWKKKQWVSTPLAVRIIASAAEGLHYAHTRVDERGVPLQVVHRDISPQNILVSFDGAVKVVDFGIAKAADMTSSTKAGTLKGKLAYMSPEQAQGKPLDARADVFSLGLVFYELLSGVKPLRRDSEISTLQAAIDCQIQPPSKVAEIPDDLDEIVMGALQKNAADRYPDARTFQMHLEEYLVSRRLVTTSAHVSQLMDTLFSERKEEEAKLGRPNPAAGESNTSVPIVEDDNPALPKVAPKARPKPPVPSAAPPPKAEISAVPIDLESQVLATQLDPELNRPKPSVSERRTRPKVPVYEPPEQETTPVDAKVQMQAKKTGRRTLPASGGIARWVKRAVVLLVLGSAMVFAWNVRHAPFAWLHRFDIRQQSAVVLNVETSPQTVVGVRKADEPKDAEAKELGDVPLRGSEEVSEGDVLVFVNKELGIFSEMVVPKPVNGRTVNITKVFGEGQLLVATTPSKVEGLVIYRGLTKVGNVGTATRFYEGKHRLEIRGPTLKAPVPIEAEIVPGKMTRLSVDLSAALAK